MTKKKRKNESRKKKNNKKKLIIKKKIIIIMPVVVGALGSVSKKLAGHLEQLGIKNRTRTMQKSALLGSAHILRKVLEV